ncbi:hypothetical protein KIN20_020285 [Parelaphostrongylus tenuis]|uniref:Uncharacterized protein n=1 Tax=Parelaphostrongylus tenuis TaxID=148309 RepID=A0AAD5QT60_PARTN|nr:hypothetical protein KIN20_020285 [Parelaphostrongylus tenuis]
MGCINNEHKRRFEFKIQFNYFSTGSAVNSPLMLFEFHVVLFDVQFNKQNGNDLQKGNGKSCGSDAAHQERDCGSTRSPLTISPDFRLLEDYKENRLVRHLEVSKGGGDPQAVAQPTRKNLGGFPLKKKYEETSRMQTELIVVTRISQLRNFLFELKICIYSPQAKLEI